MEHFRGDEWRRGGEGEGEIAGEKKGTNKDRR